MLQFDFRFCAAGEGETGDGLGAKAYIEVFLFLSDEIVAAYFTGCFDVLLREAVT